jgi:tetratricopeptide (TPR) repeat protein/ABC-type cobalamin/Fe3+-siderophores transport system ATPase subunit
MIELQTLGPLIIRTNGQEVACPRKVALLLVLLADSGELTAKKAGALLWPTADQARGLHSLNQALYSLRRIIGKEGITSTESTVRLTSSVLWDYDVTLKRLAVGDVTGALELVQGMFLSRVEIEDGDSFEEWRDQKWIFLSSQLMRAILAEVNVLTDNRDWKQLKHVSEQAQRTFPRLGILQLASIKALIGLGFNDEAARAFDAFKSNIEANRIDLPDGYPPFEELNRSVQPAAKTSSRAMFVGRANELHTLEQSLADARAGNGNVVVLVGTAGIGKTTLCEAFIARAVRQGTKVITAAAYPTERHIGYNMLAEALQSHVTREDLDKLPGMLRAAATEILPDVDLGASDLAATQLGPEAAQRRLFEALTRLIQLISERQTLLMVFEDVHWADDATLTWLNYFARRAASHRILIVVSTRLEEQHRLLVKEITHVRNAPVHELSLTELTRSEASELVRRTKPEWFNEATVADLTRVTGGHPLLLAEALKSDSVDEAKVPGTVHLRYIAAQLSLLEPGHKRLLDWLAVAGTPLSTRTLSALTGITPIQIGHGLDQLSGFVTGLAGGLLAYKHDLIRESVYQAIPMDKRTILHSELAHELQRTGGPAGLLAHHFQEGGLRDEALQYALEAAAHSELIHAYPEAEYFYRLAMHVIEDKNERISIAARLGEMLFRTGAYKKATPVLAELVAYHSSEPRTYIEWEWRYLKSMRAPGAVDAKGLFDRAQQLERVAREINHAEALFGALEVQTGLCYQSFAVSSEELPRIRQALLDLARKNPLTPTGTNALTRVGLDIAMSRNAEEGLSWTRQAMAWSVEMKDHELQIQASRNLATALYLAGHFEESRATAERGLNLIEASGAVLYLNWLLMTYATLLLELDAPTEADRYLSRLEAADPETDEWTHLFGLSNRAIFEFYLGNYAKAIEKADQFIEAKSIDTWMEISARGTRGLALLQLGRVKESFDEADRIAPIVNEPRYWVGDLSSAFRLLARTAELRNQEGNIIPLLESADRLYSVRDYVCARGIRLALAEALARSGKVRALSLCESVIADTASKGLLGLNSQARALHRKLQRKSRS